MYVENTCRAYRRAHCPEPQCGENLAYLVIEGHSITRPAAFFRLQSGVKRTNAVATRAATRARLSAEFRLPMADSLILATARRFEAVLSTQDVDFDGLPKVRYFAAATA